MRDVGMGHRELAGLGPKLKETPDGEEKAALGHNEHRFQKPGESQAGQSHTETHTVRAQP